MLHVSSFAASSRRGRSNKKRLAKGVLKGLLTKHFIITLKIKVMHDIVQHISANIANVISLVENTLCVRHISIHVKLLVF